jgi:hypothetical protein
LAVARLVSRALAPPAVPAELTSRLVGSALAARWRRRLARGVGVGVAFAASVAVAVVLLEPKPQTITEAPREVAVAKPARPSAPEMPLGEAVTEAREALVSLTRRTATETRDSSASVIPNPKLPDMSEPGPGLEPLADAQAGAARSVEPIQASARRAINLFLRAADPPSKSAVQ